MNDNLTSTNENMQADNTPLYELDAVKLWNKRLKDATSYFEEDFKRMQENMEFAANIQWEGQDKMDEDRYTANFITHFINEKVSSLYARNPKAIAKCRNRLNYTLWDGSTQQLVQAQQAMQMSMMTGMVSPVIVQAQMLMQDFQQGQLWEQQCQRVGKTLEYVYSYQCDSQQPSFKYQLKQLVRRVITTGVGFVRINYIAPNSTSMPATGIDDSKVFRLRRAQTLMQEIANDNIQPDDPRVEQLKLLLQSPVDQFPTSDIQESIEFDFPSATSIIIDPRCRSIKGFIGADWIAQKYILPLDTANSYFELTGDRRITTGGTMMQYGDDGNMIQSPQNPDRPDDKQRTPCGCFWEVFDITTRTTFWICDGWKTYVQEPQPVNPELEGFWPIFGLTFNDVEVEPGQKVHIYPPSDVQLLKPMQKEKNRTRQELREHRVANRLFFYGLAGLFDDEDLEKLANHKTGEFIKLKQPLMGANNMQNIVDAIGKWTGAPIDRNMFDSAPIDQDATMAVGSNQVQQGMPIRHVAATPAVIQEQARMSNVNSNVDDLDDMLSSLAKAGGEIILKRFDPTTVTRIAGKGAVFPQDRTDFINAIYLDIEAASSGRPNKAVEIANFERIAPIMLQTGANPIAVIEEAVKRLDDNLDVTKFYPQLGAIPMQQSQQAPAPVQSHQVTGQPALAARPQPGVMQQ